MNIQLLSDLHLESQPDFVPTHAPGADVLVLAGDVGSYQRGSALTARGEPDFGLGRFAHWPVPVLFVPGNHEYDAQDFDAAHQRLADICQRLGLIWLERQTTVLHGVRFVGTTLWSDFDALTPRHADMATQANARAKAFRAANHYMTMFDIRRHGQPFMAEQMREQSLLCQQWLRQALAQPFDGPTVVVTHFAPSLRSHDPRYGLTPGTAGFCNALDELLPQAHLWLHGHLHCALDWRDSGPRATRVVANPLGYDRKGEQRGFLPHQLIEVPGP